MQVIKDDINVPLELAKFARVEEDGHTVQVCDLPIGKNINDGSGVIYWVNRGFTPYDEFMSKRHAAEVKKEQDEAAKTAEKKK